MGTLVFIAVYDVRTNKIKNQGILCLYLFGLLFRLQDFQLANLSQVAINLLLPIILLYPLFLLHVLGAGDIKLFSAIGLFLNTNSLLYWIGYSFVLGALIGLALLLYRGELVASMKRLYGYLLEAAYCFPELKPYSKEENFQKNVIHFSVAMALGYLLLFGISS